MPVRAAAGGQRGGHRRLFPTPPLPATITTPGGRARSARGPWSIDATGVLIRAPDATPHSRLLRPRGSHGPRSSPPRRGWRAAATKAGRSARHRRSSRSRAISTAPNVSPRPSTPSPRSERQSGHSCGDPATGLVGRDRHQHRDRRPAAINRSGRRADRRVVGRARSGRPTPRAPPTILLEAAHGPPSCRRGPAPGPGQPGCAWDRPRDAGNPRRRGPTAWPCWPPANGRGPRRAPGKLAGGAGLGSARGELRRCYETASGRPSAEVIVQLDGKDRPPTAAGPVKLSTAKVIGTGKGRRRQPNQGRGVQTGSDSAIRCCTA